MRDLGSLRRFTLTLSDNRRPVGVDLSKVRWLRWNDKSGFFAARDQ
jgi:hypothetical protein